MSKFICQNSAKSNWELRLLTQNIQFNRIVSLIGRESERLTRDNGFVVFTIWHKRDRRRNVPFCGINFRLLNLS